MEKKMLNKKQIMELIAFSGVVLLVVFNMQAILKAVKYLIGILTPFTIGAAMAFVLHVPMGFLERKVFGRWIKGPKIRRIISCLVTIILVFTAVNAIFFFIIPELSEAINTLISKAPGQVMRFYNWIEPYFRDTPIIDEWIVGYVNGIDWQEFIRSGFQFVSYGAGSIFNSTLGIIASIATSSISIMVGFIFSIYVLFEKENLARQGKKVIYGFLREDVADEIVHVLRVIHESFANFISGQVLESIILGSLFWITLSIFRFPYALLIGVLISVTALIPIVGAFIGCFIGAFLLIVIDPMMAFWFILIFLALQQLEGNLIYPFVVGNKIGIPSMWVLMAVTVGGSLMGIIGILLFIPLFSVIYTLIKEKTNMRLTVKGIDQKKWTE